MSGVGCPVALDVADRYIAAVQAGQTLGTGTFWFNAEWRAPSTRCRTARTPRTGGRSQALQPLHRSREGACAFTRGRNEEAIRAAMDRLLRGDLPPGRKCDLKTLAQEAGVTRTGFYPKKNRDGTTRPGLYQHLAEEFGRRLQARHHAGEVFDP